jgi:hypothetical protein
MAQQTGGPINLFEHVSALNSMLARCDTQAHEETHHPRDGPLSLSTDTLGGSANLDGLRYDREPLETLR